MKKKKLNLNELHVSSFITETNPDLVKGGATEGCGNTFDYCNTVPVNQCNIASYNAACPTLPVQDCNVVVNTYGKIACGAISLQVPLCIDIRATEVC